MEKVAQVTTRQYEKALTAWNVANTEAERLIKLRNDKIEKLQEKITAVEAEYNPDIETEMKALEKEVIIIEAYCRQNASSLFAEAKTVVTAIGLTLKMRTGQWKVVGIPDDAKEKEAFIVKFKKALPDYVRTTEAVDAKAVIAAKDLIGKKLLKLGIQVVKEDNFSIE